ncbi:hypothetical protein [Ensifer aridi]|uniref:hypothetical protein n=1 Tax=Ensifer aridi TaxID=1708715 RepID=UPI001551FEEC|nr:hypothetical protein [Ensifer aridi]
MVVDIGMITTAVSTLKTPVDIASTVKEANDLTVMRNKVIEMPVSQSSIRKRT